MKLMWRDYNMTRIKKIEILLKIHKYLPIIPAYISLLKTKYEEYEFEKTPIY